MTGTSSASATHAAPLPPGVFFKADYPLYAACVLSDGTLVLAGGGGSSKTGVPNGAEVFASPSTSSPPASPPAASTTATSSSSTSAPSSGSPAAKPSAPKDDASPRFTHAFHFNAGSNAIMNAAAHPTQPLVAAGMDQECRLLRLDSDAKVFTQAAAAVTDFRKDEPYQKVCRFSADGSLLITGGADGKARIWTVPSLDLVHTLDGHKGELKDVDLSPDKSLAVTVGEDKLLNVWDLKTATVKHTLKSDSRWDKRGSYKIQACRFTTIGDDLFLVTAHSLPRQPSRLVKWDTKKWTPLGHPVVPIGSVPLTTMAISRDCRYIGVADAEGSIAVVESAAFTVCAQVLNLHELFVTGLVFTADASHLVSISADRNCHLTRSVSKHRPGSLSLLLVLIVLLAVLALMALLTWRSL